MIISKKKIPNTFTIHLIKQFSISLIIFYLIITGLIIVTNFVEELLYLKETNFKNNLYFFSTYYTLIKTPSITINLFPFISLFASIHFFVKIIKNNEYLSLKISGISNRLIILVPSFFCFFVGMIIVFTLSPISAELTKLYEKDKKEISGNNNLLIVNENGIWIKEEKKNKEISIFKASNFQKKKNIIFDDLQIYIFNPNGDLTETYVAKTATIEKNLWNLKNVELHSGEKNTKKKYEKINLESNIKINILENIFSNADTFSIWNLYENIKIMRSRGYYGDQLIVKLHKLVSFPFLLFSTVILSTLFTISQKKSYENYIYSFLGILSGIFIYFLTDLSIAFGESGKIPLSLSVWLPIILILILSLFSLLKANEN